MTVYLQSENYIFGNANNPYDQERTTGGSSGGEGGVSATRCSPFGIGTDVLGSIRCPALFNGVFGFRSTPQRMSW